MQKHGMSPPTSRAGVNAVDNSSSSCNSHCGCAVKIACEQLMLGEKESKTRPSYTNSPGEMFHAFEQRHFLYDVLDVDNHDAYTSSLLQ